MAIISNKKVALQKRYYDYRLIYAFCILFIFHLALCFLFSRIFHTPLMMEYVQVGPNQWKPSRAFDGPYLDGLRMSLSFFEFFISLFFAGALCIHARYSTDVDFLYVLWVVGLAGLPLCINYMSNLRTWAIYSAIMLVTAWIMGKKVGFSLPIGKELRNSVYDEGTDLYVDVRRFGNFYLPGRSSLWIISIFLVGLFGLTMALFIAALLNQ